mgnify:CR=1 FL=1
MEFFKFKRLKIVEQIAVVFIFAVIIPMSISGFIINNINQQSMRYQLRESAGLIANMGSDEIDFFNKTVSSNLEQIVFSLNYFKTQEAKNAYLKSVVQKLPDCEELVVADAAQSEEIHERNKLHKKATVNLKISDGQYLVATYKMDAIKDELFKSIADDKRQIYVLTNEGDLIAEHNYTDEAFKKTVSLLPKKLKKNKPEIFGDIKNQPLVYVSKDEPKITIIVNTTEKVTLKAITNNSLKIILSCLFATFAIIFIVALYIYYLYINIRQLFKGIIAISKGNYERQIRLLTTAFTPHEIVFLAFEFNRMATEIHKSYIQLKKNNVELKQLNEFRSNLIDTVSHELRTPLTSIQGYTSRLMRQDIKIDEETRQKSLRIIKEQSERLKRLIEDLLTIPDIEGMRLRTKSEDVYLPEVLEEVLPHIDYVAMDIKAPLEDFKDGNKIEANREKTPLKKYQSITCSKIDTAKIQKSIELIMKSGVDYEFRTTVVKSQLGIEDFIKISEMIKGAKKYYLQKFLPTKLLNPEFEKETTYSDIEFSEIIRNIQHNFEEIKLRG